MDRAQLVRDYVKQFPGAQHKAIAKKLFAEYPGAWPTVSAVDCAVRRARGKQGELHRSDCDSKHFESTARSCNPLPCPPSLEEEWLPYFLPIPCRTLILSDIHVPYHSELANRVAVQFGVDNGFDSLFINGDCLDFYAVSHFLRDPRKPRLKEELERGREYLDWILPQFPGEKTIKAGNHDERWDKFLWTRAIEIFDLEELQLETVLTLKERDCKWVKDKRKVMAGKLPILHGHELPRGIASPVNPARGAFMRTLHTMMMGHLHRSSTHTEPDMMGSETTCWSTGCLCGLNPDYAPINKWNWGFATVEVDADGEFQVRNYRINKDGKVRTV